MQKKITSILVWVSFLSQQVFAMACFDAKCCCIENQQSIVPRSHQHGREKNSTLGNTLKWDGPGPRHFDDHKTSTPSGENAIDTTQTISPSTPHCHQQKVALANPPATSTEPKARDSDEVNQNDRITDHELNNLPPKNFSAPLTSPGDSKQTTKLQDANGENLIFVGLYKDLALGTPLLVKTSNENDCACEKMNAAGIYSCTCGKKVLSTPSPIQLFQAFTWEKIYQLAFVIFPLKNFYLSAPDKRPDIPPPKAFALPHKNNLA